MVGVTDILVFLLFVKFADQYLPQNNFLLKQPIALKLDINNMVGVTDIFGIISSRSYVICTVMINIFIILSPFIIWLF